MAGDGSGAGQAGGCGQDTHLRSAAPAEVPALILRTWDAAEAGLFPLIMARPHEGISLPCTYGMPHGLYPTSSNPV